MKKLTLTQDRNIIAGIDVGTSRIACAIVDTSSENGKPKLLGIGTAPTTSVRRGSIIHRDKLIEEIEQAISAAETMANEKVTQVVMSITGDHIRGINTQSAIPIHKSDNSRLPGEHEIQVEDVQRVVEQARGISFPIDRDILHVLPQEYVIDTMDGIKDPVGMSGRRLEARVHLVTTASSSATNLVKCVEELGLSCEALVFQGLASALSTLDEDEKDLGVALVDIGAGTTNIAVFYEGGVRHTGVIPIGANSITNDIAVMLQIAKSDAEKIKLKYGSAKASMASPDLEFELPSKPDEIVRNVSEHELSRYVEARMIEILQLVSREITRADIQETLTYGVVLTGGGSQLNNTVALAEEVLKLKTRLGIPKGVSGVNKVASEPQYAAVIGLTKWQNYFNQFNLMPSEPVTAKSLLKKMVHWLKNFS